nr:hypothetical protein [Tanacetum cinerariifolium]
STPIESNKPLIKDEEAEDVDVHLYRSLIGSLMYLITSRPNITFAVCDCARFQVTPKTSHLHVVKRIFKYLKGQPKLGLWYPKDPPFDLEAYSDSDYAGACLDKKSTTRAKDGRCFVDTSEVTTGNTLLSTAGLTTVGQSTMASAIICLANNQKFNFLKYIFDNMVKSFEGGIKFYLFLRFLQVFLVNQIEGMTRHKEMVVTPPFETIMVQAATDMGDTPVETHQPPIVDQPSTSRPQKKQKPRKKQRKEAEEDVSKHFTVVYNLPLAFFDES